MNRKSSVMQCSKLIENGLKVTGDISITVTRMEFMKYQ